MKTVDVPEIQTDRLRLRGHQPRDLDACLSMWTDPLVTRFIGGQPSSEQQTWARILGYIGHWAFLGFGYWALEHKSSGEFIGEVGFADFKRNIDPSMRDVPELGWALTSAVHGQGYGTEAVLAASAWGDAHLPAARTVCMINSENLASLRVAQRCGYLEFVRGHFNEWPTLFFQRTERRLNRQVHRYRP